MALEEGGNQLFIVIDDFFFIVTGRPKGTVGFHIEVHVCKGLFPFLEMTLLWHESWFIQFFSKL